MSSNIIEANIGLIGGTKFAPGKIPNLSNVVDLNPAQPNSQVIYYDTVLDTMNIRSGGIGTNTADMQIIVSGADVTTLSLTNATGGALTINNTNTGVGADVDINTRGSGEAYLGNIVNENVVAVGADFIDLTTFGPSSEILLSDDVTGNFIDFTAAGITILPLGDPGTAGQFLQTDGTGLATWQTPAFMLRIDAIEKHLKITPPKEQVKVAVPRQHRKAVPRSVRVRTPIVGALPTRALVVANSQPIIATSSQRTTSAKSDKSIEILE
jgi:hypothetical protein